MLLFWLVCYFQTVCMVITSPSDSQFQVQLLIMTLQSFNSHELLITNLHFWEMQKTKTQKTETYSTIWCVYNNLGAVGSYLSMPAVKQEDVSVRKRHWWIFQLGGTNILAKT